MLRTFAPRCVDALRLLAEEVVLVEVSPQVRILRVEVLQPVRVAEVAEVGELLAICRKKCFVIILK